MDEDEFLDGFRSVFAYLKSDNCNIPDDAILHIFVDVLKTTLRDFESINRCCLVEFLDDVGDVRETLDDGIICVALEIAGWLGSDEERFAHFLLPISKHLRSIWKKSSIGDVSVLSSLFTCLSSISKHEKGVEWLITENEDIHREWLSILEKGSSIFLQKAVVQYIASLCTSPGIQRFTHVLEHIVSSDLLPVVRKYSTVLQEKQKPLSSSFFLSILKLLEDMCLSVLVCDIIASTNLMEELESVILLANRSEAQATINVVQAFGNIRNIDVEPLIERISRKLFDEGDILLAQSVVIVSSQIKVDPAVVMYQEIMLAPLKYVLGQNEMGEQRETSVPLTNLHRQMSSKHQTTSILCKTVTNIASVKLVVPDMISGLLAATLTEPLTELVEVNPDLKHHVQNNTKVQRSCLQYLCDFEAINGQHIYHALLAFSHQYLHYSLKAALITPIHTLYDTDQEDLTVQIGSSLTQIMSPSSVDPQTYSACVKCLSPVLPRLLASTNNSRNITEKVAFILQQQLCSLQWEQRDTTLEFLSGLITKYKERLPVVYWIEQTGLHHHIWQCRLDGESYVRASAIVCLYSISTCGQLWTSLLDMIDLSEAEVIKEIGKILTSDTEAFTRRSAANFLFKFYCDRADNLPDEVSLFISTTVGSRILDFDWEVKLTVLEFMEEFLHREVFRMEQATGLPEYAKGLQTSEISSRSITESLQKVFVRLRNVFDLGCLQVLETALGDYDQKVVEKAVNVTGKFKHELMNLSDKVGVSKDEFLDRLGKLCYKGTASKPIDRNLGDVKNTVEEDVKQTVEEVVSDTVKAFDKIVGADVVQRVGDILSFNEANHCKKYFSEDDYTKSPISIIQDILSYGKKSEEDNVVDCY